MPPKGGKVVKSAVVPILTERQQIKLLEEQAKEATKAAFVQQVEVVKVTTPKIRPKRGAKAQDEDQNEGVGVPVIEPSKKVTPIKIAQIEVAVVSTKPTPTSKTRGAIKTTPKLSKNKQDMDDFFDEDDDDDGSAGLAHQSMDISSIGKTPSKAVVTAGSRSSSRNVKKPDYNDSPLETESTGVDLNKSNRTEKDVSVTAAVVIATPNKSRTKGTPNKTKSVTVMEVESETVAVESLTQNSSDMLTSAIAIPVTGAHDVTSTTNDVSSAVLDDVFSVSVSTQPATTSTIKKLPRLILSSPESTNSEPPTAPSNPPAPSTSHLPSQIQIDLENMRNAAMTGRLSNSSSATKMNTLSSSHSSGALNTSSSSSTVDKYNKKIIAGSPTPSTTSISYKKKSHSSNDIGKQSVPFVVKETPGQWVKELEELIDNNEILVSAKLHNTNTMTSSYHPEITLSSSGSSQWGTYLAVNDEALRASCKIGYKPSKSDIIKTSSSDSKRHASVLDSWIGGDSNSSNKAQKIDNSMPPPSSSQSTSVAANGTRVKSAFPTATTPHRKPLNSTFKYDPYAIYPPCEEGFLLDQAERDQTDMRRACVESSTSLRDANIIFGRNKEWLHPETEFTNDTGEFTLSSALSFWGIRPSEPLFDTINRRGVQIDQDIARRQAEINREIARKQAELEAAAAQKLRLEEEKRQREAKRIEDKRRAEEKRAEDKRKAEEKRIEDQRRAEEKRIDDQRRAEEKRIEDQRRAEEKRLLDLRLAEEKLAAEKAEREALKKRREEQEARRVEQERLQEVEAQRKREVNAKAERERADRDRIRQHEQMLEQERLDKQYYAKKEQDRLKQANSLQQSAMSKLQPNGVQSAPSAAVGKNNRFASTSNKGVSVSGFGDQSSTLPPNLSINPFQPIKLDKAPPLVIKTVASLHSSIPSLNAGAAAAVKAINAQLAAVNGSSGGDPVFAAFLQQAKSTASEVRSASPITRPVPALTPVSRVETVAAVTQSTAPVVVAKSVISTSTHLSTDNASSVTARANLAQQVIDKRDGGRRDDSRQRDRVSYREDSRDRKRDRDDNRDRRDGPSSKRGRDGSRERGGSSKHHQSSAPRKIDVFGREIPARPQDSRDARDHHTARRDDHHHSSTQQQQQTQSQHRSAPPTMPSLIDTNNKEQMARFQPASGSSKPVARTGWEEVPIQSIEEKRAGMAYNTLSSSR